MGLETLIGSLLIELTDKCDPPHLCAQWYEYEKCKKSKKKIQFLQQTFNLF